MSVNGIEIFAFNYCNLRVRKKKRKSINTKLQENSKYLLSYESGFEKRVGRDSVVEFKLKYRPIALASF
jgi:hypothetical protein